MKNIFDKKINEEIISRINKIKPDRKAQWGSMSPDQMFAHCNVPYEMTYSDTYPRLKGFNPDYAIGILLRNPNA